MDTVYAFVAFENAVFIAGLFGELGHRETSVGSSFWKRTIGSESHIFAIPILKSSDTNLFHVF